MSSKNLPTLRGVFPQPKVQPKRDFLRENKLKLKDLQKHLINRKQLEQEISERNLVRINQHNGDRKLLNNPKTLDRPRRSASVNSLMSNGRRSNSACSTQHNCYPHTSSGTTFNNKPSATPVTFSRGMQCLCSNARVCVGGCRRESAGFHNHKVDTAVINCDKEIQTDDILDQVFLSDALKRCCSVENGQDDIDNYNMNLNELALHDQNDNQSTISRLMAHQLNNNYKQPYHQVQSHHNQNSTTLPLNLDIENLETNQIRPGTNQTNHTNIDDHQLYKRKINRTKLLCGAPDFGNRGDIKLPKYLEKQKRERELQKYRDMEKDPNCPEGHSLLGDKDRLDALEEAQKKFQGLISELNHMPMSSETLRTRTRKNEIEKALVNLEHEIRAFSKQKVYVKDNE